MSFVNVEKRSSGFANSGTIKKFKQCSKFQPNLDLTDQLHGDSRINMVPSPVLENDEY